jgi:SAM-dependent methyltransferase
MVLDYRVRLYRSYMQSRGEAVVNAAERLRPRAAYLRALIRDNFPADRDAAVVDLGCGYGALIYFARQGGYRHLEGIDRSPEQIAAARRLGIDGVREDDLMRAISSMPAESRDVVVTFDVIEHFRKDEVMAFVDQVRRVLRPDGRWIIHTVNGESPFAGRVRWGDFTHELAFTRASLTQVLRSSGFARVECYEDVPIPHGIKSSIRWFLWKGIRAGLRLWLAIETGDSARTGIFSQNLLAVALKS